MGEKGFQFSIFFTKVKTVTNKCIYPADYKKVYNLRSVHPLWLCNLCVRLAQHTIGVHRCYCVHRPLFVYLFGISTTYLVILDWYEKDQRKFFEKTFFIQGSPNGFWGIYLIVFGTIKG